MKVLHVISGIDAAAGGTATALQELAIAQKGVGLDVGVVSTFAMPATEAANRLQDHGIEVNLIGPVEWPLARHREITPKLRELIVDADLVHTHGMWEEIQHRGTTLARELHVPYVMSPHGMLDPWSLSQGKVKKNIYLFARMRRNLNMAAAIHFTTQTERDLVAPMKFLAPAIIEPNGVNLSEFQQLPPRGTFRSKHNLGDRPVVLFLGRLHYKKGFDLLVPAFAQLEQKDAVLVIAGPDGGSEGEIRQLLEQHGLTDRAIFTGMLRDQQRVEAFVDADLFALPSYQENFGIAVVEALAAGCPVLVSDQVNICRELIAAKVGEVVPTQVAPLAAKMNELMADPARRAEMAQRGPNFVRAHFDWNEIAKHWVKRYDELRTPKRSFYGRTTVRVEPRPRGKSIRVLHVIANLDYETGGPAIALAGLTRAQRDVGLDVSIVSTFPKNAKLNLAYELRRQGQDVRLIGPGSGKLVRHPLIVPTIHEMLEKADIVHIHGLWEEIHHQAATEAQMRGIPYIIRTCGMLDPWSMRQRPFRKMAYMTWRLRRNLNNAASVHCTSEGERDLLERLHLRAPRIVEPNGVDLAEFDNLPQRGVFRHRYSGIGDRPIVLFLGRLHYKKGLDLLVPAFASGTSGEVMLVIAGPDGDGYQAKIERLVDLYKLNDRVLFTGMLYGKERIEALADADLFVLPSYQENFGIAVVEALCSGCPVLVSDKVNIHKQITDAGVGGMVPTRVEPLAAALTRWMGDREMRLAAAGRTREFVRQHYDWRAIAQRWSERYERLTARRTVPVATAATAVRA